MAEASSDGDGQLEVQPPSAVPDSSTLLRRSLRNARPSIIPAVPSAAAPGQNASSSTTTSQKRKSDASSDDTRAALKRTRAAQTAKETTTQQPNSTWKDKELWPEFDKGNITYYANDGATKYAPGEGDETPESRSPKKPTRGVARGGRGQGNGGGRRGRFRGRGGRGGGGGSPDPPERRLPLTQEEKGVVSLLKARQQELKRFFSTIGAQQLDILEQMASRDISKISKKANAHKKVPEYDEIVDELQSARQDAEDTIRKRYDIEVESELRKYEAEKEVLEQQLEVS